MNRHFSVIHAIAKCDDCGWEPTCYKNAQANSASHAKRYGHKVAGELGIGFGYDARADGPRVARHTKYDK